MSDFTNENLTSKQLNDLVITKDEQGDIKDKLKKLGFLNTEFESKARHRFFVKIAGLPAHLIKSVSRPSYNANKEKWYGNLEIEVYNATKENVEQKVIDLVKQKEIRIKILILDTDAEIITTWDIQAKDGIVSFGSLNWSVRELNAPDIISVSFVVESVSLEYNTK